MISEDIVKLKKINTVEQITDLMTKALVKTQFEKTTRYIEDESD